MSVLKGILGAKDRIKGRGQNGSGGGGKSGDVKRVGSDLSLPNYNAPEGGLDTDTQSTARKKTRGKTRY